MHVDMAIEKLGLVGEIQLATFHPDYCFSDLSQDDVRNYTNRSLYPMFHFIREDSIEQMRGVFNNIELIPEQNMEKLQSIGLEGIESQISACYLNQKKRPI